MSVFYINNIYKGNVAERKMAKGNTWITKTYKGQNSRFQYLADIHLICSLEKDSLAHEATTTLSINTTGKWWISYAGSGISFSSMSGNGNSNITVTAGNIDGEYNFTVNTDFKSESFTVDVVGYTRLAWLYYNDNFSWSDWYNHGFCFTSILPDINMKMRYRFIQRVNNSNFDIGTPTDNSTGDNYARISSWSINYYLKFSSLSISVPSAQGENDITFSNFQIYDNINNTVLDSGSIQTGTIVYLRDLVFINPVQKIFEFMVYDENDNLLLDAIPVILNNQVGMLDTVGGGFYTVADQQMIPVYELA